MRTFKKGAAASSRKNLLLSTAEGVGLGVLGIGLPDIPFTGMILKSIYEVALITDIPMTQKKSGTLS